MVLNLGAPADVEQLLCQMLERLGRLIALLEREEQPQVAALTRPLPTTDFVVFSAPITTSPTVILDGNERRVTFAIIIPAASSIRLGPSSFDPGVVPAISGSDLAVVGLDGHVGPVWAQSSVAFVATVIAQFADPG